MKKALVAYLSYALLGFLFGFNTMLYAAKPASTVNLGAQPLFLYTPLTPVAVSVFPGINATVSYQIQSNPIIPYTLYQIGVVNLPRGVVVSGGSCGLAPFTLRPGQTCTFTLLINGNEVAQSFRAGPQLSCTISDRVYNSKPPTPYELQVTKVEIPRYRVTARGDTYVTPNPVEQLVPYNKTGTIILNAAPNHGFAIASDTCGGTLTGATYTTGPITRDCEVHFISTPVYTVTATGDSHVTPSPSSQSVNPNATGTVTLTVAPGYTASIGSDTCGGSLNGTTYTTGPVVQNCTVSFTATLNTYTVTAAGDSHVTPSPTSQTVNYNATGTVTLTVTPGYTASIGSNTCGGSLNGTTYITGPVVQNCTVSFTATLNTYTVTATGDSHVTPSPTSQTVNYNSTGTITLNVSTGYTASIASDTCGGTLTGTTYTTGPITSNCAVSFNTTLNTYTVTATGDSNVTPSPTSQTVNYNATGTITLNVSPHYTASIASDTCGGTLIGTTYTTGPITSNCAVSFSATLNSYTVTATGDSNVTPTPTSQTVNYNSTGTVTLTVSAGYEVRIDTDTCGGTLTGTTYVTGPVIADCAVSFISETPFAVAAGPGYVFATPGNATATISWTPPTNTGTGTISGYVVTYGPISGIDFTTPGCTTTGVTSCTVTGLTNNTTYTFMVRTNTTQNGFIETGPPSYSSPVTPVDGLTVSPSTMALSSENGSARIITVLNTSQTPYTISNTPTTNDFSPSLPTGTVLSGTNCVANTTLNQGQSCTITMTPGTVASYNVSTIPCTSFATFPQTSVLTLTTQPANTVSINVVVLGLGCISQQGHLFFIDENTQNPTQSIGGKIVTFPSSIPPNLLWSSSLDVIWGIDDSSTASSPSPNDTSSTPATLKLGQLNCDAVNDGACASNNIVVYYSSVSPNTYAAGFCSQPLDGISSTPCSGSTSTPCFTDWYLPSVCDLGPFGSGGPSYPSNPSSQSCLSTTNIYGVLSSNIILPNTSWSSVEDSTDPAQNVWVQSSLQSQFTNAKNSAITPASALCVRNLTF